jgi:solute carrier family 25 (mitochondrial citrate transporter), member 1
MNSMVWYSTYSALQQLMDPSRDSITELELLGMGFASSLAVVAVTQPMDIIKTRMQSRDYRVVYKDMMTCIALIFFREGAGKFWAGAVPRFVKVSCSSTVTLLTYQWVTAAVNQLSEIKPFAA